MGRDTRLASTRVQTFVKSFPRCGIPDAFPDWESYRRRVDLLERTRSIVTATQIWWSVRPHHSFGTLEVRICDGQTEMGEALGVAALALACIAGFAADHDAGRPLPVHERGLIEENIWRAQRYGVEGELIDLDRGEVRSVAAAVEELLAWSAPHHGRLGLTPFLDIVRTMLETGNGATRQRALFAESGDPVALHAHNVERTRASAHEVLARLDAGAAELRDPAMPSPPSITAHRSTR